MTDPMTEAAAKAMCGRDVEWRDCETPCMQANKCAGHLSEYRIADAQAAITAIEPMIRAQVEREIVEWLRKEAVFSTDPVRRRITEMLNAIEAGVYRWTAEGVPFPKQGSIGSDD